MLPNQLLEARRVSTDHLLNILAVLEDDKGRHGADVERSRQIRQLINVKLDKIDALEIGMIRHPAEALEMMNNALGRDTYLERMGEMALQGPHQVAKQSTRTALSVVETSSLNSSVLDSSTLVEKYRFVFSRAHSRLDIPNGESGSRAVERSGGESNGPRLNSLGDDGSHETERRGHFEYLRCRESQV